MSNGRTARLLLVRHCTALHQGPEAPLSAAGEQAAQQLATRLLHLGVDAVYSSPYERALATVRPFSDLYHVERSFSFDSWRALQNPDLFVMWWKRGFPLGYERSTQLA